MTKQISENQVLIWQDTAEGMPEPALLITKYEDIISVEQEGRYINLNPETLKEFIKALKP